MNHPHRIGDAGVRRPGSPPPSMPGSRVPRTLITSNPDAARTFIKGSDRTVIYKPLHNPVYRIDNVPPAWSRSPR
ncbi:hypothetical protein [Streptomyces sp. KL116D]|uniref:hypothetical protein n=1 Tax=Streptomyces sp. KL116D TaxID=3045152 RepID=UPI00355910A4